MAVLDAALVGHWTFDAADISGATAYDRSGNSNNATLYNGPTQVAGQVGGALNYDGVNDYVSAPNAASLNIPNTLTISLWLKPAASYVGYASHLVSKWTSTADANYVFYYFGTTSGSDRRLVFYGNRGGVWAALHPSSFTAPLNTWKHIVMTYSSATGGIFYVDGAVSSSWASAGVLATNSGTSSRQVLDSAQALSGQANVLRQNVDEFLSMVRSSS